MKTHALGWEIRNDLDYYQGGTYIAAPPFYHYVYVNGKSTRKEGLPESPKDRDFYGNNICRVEDEKFLPMLLAAPDMLDALKSMVKEMKSHFDSGDHGYQFEYESNAAYGSAISAIAKAEGRE